VLQKVRAFFEFEAHETDFVREAVAGATTFMTMSYIIVVNPAILQAAGMPIGPATVATILASVVGTLLMGLYARRPFAIAPYMGENAFIAYTVVGVLGIRWQTALGAVFIAGVLFLLLTVVRLRVWLVEAVPPGLRHSFAVGMGLFLTFIGLNAAGIVERGVQGAPVRVGHVTSPGVLLAIAGCLLQTALLVRRIPGAILIGILGTTGLAYATGLATLPRSFFGWPPDPGPVLLQLDIRGALSWDLFAVVLTIFVMAFVDTMGTLYGVAARAGFLDEEGNLPQIERPMLADALSTTAAALLGTTASGAYVESAAGVEAGGRTGFTAVVTAALFLLALFVAPFVTAVPAQAYAPAMIVVGLLMLSSVRRVRLEDPTELVPAFAVIALMSFTYNVGIGITGGFLLYPFCKIVAGRWREIRPGLWVLALLSLLFFLFYPYG
jgi:adenine/guanine/hypoxanthine permease